MRKNVVALVLIPFLLMGAESSCGSSKSGSKGAPEAGNNRPSASAQATEEPTDAATEEPDETAPVKLGETFKYTDGLAITISKPQPYKPSPYAAVKKSPYYRLFIVTIVNGTGKRYDTSQFSTTLQSANEEADESFDSEKGLEGAPSTTLLPGREARFKIGYGMTSATDLVLEANPGFAYENAIFIS